MWVWAVCVCKCTFSKLIYCKEFVSCPSAFVKSEIHGGGEVEGYFLSFCRQCDLSPPQFPHCNSLTCSHTHQPSSFLLVIHQCCCFLTHTLLLAVHYTCTRARPYTPKPLHTLITVICSILTHSHTHTSPGKRPAPGSPAFSPPLRTEIASMRAHIYRFIPSGRKLWYSYSYFCCLSGQSFCGAPWQEDQYLS